MDIPKIKLKPIEQEIVKYLSQHLSAQSLDSISKGIRKAKSTIKNHLLTTSPLLMLGFVGREDTGLYSFNQKKYDFSSRLSKYIDKYKESAWFQYLFDLANDANEPHIHDIILYSDKFQINYEELDLPISNNERNKPKKTTIINELGKTNFVFYQNGAIRIEFKGLNSNNIKTPLTIPQFITWVISSGKYIKEISNRENISIKEFKLISVSIGKDIPDYKTKYPNMKVESVRLSNFLGVTYELYEYTGTLRIAKEMKLVENVTLNEFVSDQNLINILKYQKEAGQHSDQLNNIEHKLKNIDNCLDFDKKQIRKHSNILNDLSTKVIPTLGNSIDQMSSSFKDILKTIHVIQKQKVTLQQSNKINSLEHQIDRIGLDFNNFMDNIELNQVEDGKQLQTIVYQIKNLKNTFSEFAGYQMDFSEHIDSKIDNLQDLAEQFYKSLRYLAKQQKIQNENMNSMNKNIYSLINKMSEQQSEYLKLLTEMQKQQSLSFFDKIKIKYQKYKEKKQI